MKVEIQVTDPSVPEWRVLDVIASLLAPNAPQGIGWHPVQWNRDITIMVNRDGSIVRCQDFYNQDGSWSGAERMSIGSWSLA